jgi:hypothetical protein
MNQPIDLPWFGDDRDNPKPKRKTSAGQLWSLFIMRRRQLRNVISRHDRDCERLERQIAGIERRLKETGATQPPAWAVEHLNMLDGKY